MNVLLVPYPGSWSVGGGHITQIRQSAQALLRAGVNVAIGPMPQDNCRAFDVVHVFGLPHEPICRDNLRVSKVVVSPVYFSKAFDLGPHYSRGGMTSMAGRRVRHLAGRARHLKQTRQLHGEATEHRLRLLGADAIIVNSHAEGRLLAKDVSVSLPPIHVAYSGVDEVFFNGDATSGRRLVGCSDFVLCVGRPEPTKNQITLCAATARLDVPLVMVGTVLPGNERILQECRKLQPSLRHFSNLSQVDLADVYAAARVHVLPSWYETTGLATLEAMAAGTPVVVGYNPCTAEYVGDCAWMHPPGSVRKLRGAIREALEGPRGCEQEVARRFSWDRTATQLLQAYAAGRN